MTNELRNFLCSWKKCNITFSFFFFPFELQYSDVVVILLLLCARIVQLGSVNA